jgi:argininosuccinate lyase
LCRAHDSLDRSVAGVGGSAGSRWPLDRALLAELLGHAEIELHAKDAMWQADPFLELASDLAIAATNWAQQAQDLEILASQEFGMVELDDGHSRASALMPQKRNPYALVAARAQAGEAAGLVTGMLVTLHTGTARTDHFHLLNADLPRVLASTAAVGRLHAAVLSGLRVDTARMTRAAVEAFICAADVADVLAADGGLDYRTAHTVVGRAVRGLDAEGRTPGDLTPERLAAAAEEVVGHGVRIDAATLARALDPAECARERRQLGSSRPGELSRMLADVRGRIARGRSWSEERAERAEASRNRLLERARDVAGTGGAAP